MPRTDIHSTCPAPSTLLDWVEGTLDGAAADRVEQHLDGCSRCRRQALDWSDQLDAGPTDEGADCIDAEALVAYSAGGGGLERGAAAQIETHIHQCTRCVSILQQFVRLQRELGAAASAPALRAETAAAVVAGEAVASPRAGRRVRAAAPAWWQWLGDLLTPRMWTGAALATAMALIVAIGVSRFLSPSGPYEEMRVRNAAQAVSAELIADTVGRPRPAADEPALVELSRGTQVRWLETNGQWTRIELEDGRRVWVDSKAVARGRIQ